MRICLMSNIIHNFIMRRIEHIVQSDNKFYRTQTRSQVTGIHRTTIYYILSDFPAKVFKLSLTKVLEIRRAIYTFQHIHDS